jgi:multiple sugar transport system substrate-binding protein
MYFTKTLMVAAALLGSSAQTAAVEDINLSFIMCGDERPADKAAIEKFQVDNPGVKVAMEIVPWGHLPK